MSDLWKSQVTKVYIVPVVICSLGMVWRNVSRYIEVFGSYRLQKPHKVCLLGTTGSLRKVLDYNDETGGIWGMNLV